MYAISMVDPSLPALSKVLLTASEPWGAPALSLEKL